jgi:hypothetical protein
MMIYDLLEQIEKGVGSKLYHMALSTALTIPDIGGAVDSEDGVASGKKYAAWFDTYVAPKYYAWGTQYLTGRDCYLYRCVMLHQGRSHAPNSTYSKTVLMVAKQQNIAYCGAFTVDDGSTLCVDVPLLCSHIVQSAYEWLEKVEDTDRFKKNSAKFVELFTLSFEGV